MCKPFLATIHFKFEPRESDELFFPTVRKGRAPSVIGIALYMCTGSSESDEAKMVDGSLVAVPKQKMGIPGLSSSESTCPAEIL